MTVDRTMPEPITSAAEAIEQAREAWIQYLDPLLDEYGDLGDRAVDIREGREDGETFIAGFLAALSTRLSEPEQGGGETGWLIEHGKAASPLYWTGESWGKWSGDHRQACRFARREDAFKVSLTLGDPSDWPNNHRVVEHAWSGK